MEKIVLFCVNGHSRTADLILKAEKNDIETADKLSRLMQDVRTFGFDEILLQLEQFRGCYERIKDFGNKAVSYITKGRDIREAFAAEYNALISKEKNIFSRHYAEWLWETYAHNREQLNNIVGTVTNAVTNRKTEKDYKKYLLSIINEMERVVLTDWHYNHIPDTENVLLRADTECVILRGNGVNQMFRIIGGSLLPFLYEYSYAVGSIGLSVYECRYCHRHYLHTRDNYACPDEKCQIQKKKDHFAGKKDMFSNIKTGYQGYVRQLKYRLTSAHKCECAIDLFNDAKARCENKLSSLIDEYRDDKRSPDTDFDIVLNDIKGKMKNITDKLLNMSDSEIEKKYDERLEGDLVFEIEALKYD